MKRFAKIFSLILVTMLVFFAGAGPALAGFDDDDGDTTADTKNVNTGDKTGGVMGDWADQTDEEAQPITKPLAKNMPYIYLIGGVSILMYYAIKTSTNKKHGHIEDAGDDKDALNHAGKTLLKSLIYIALFVAIAKGKMFGIL